MADGWLEQPFSLKGLKVWVAGHTGLVGSAMVRRLSQEACKVVFPDERIDLRDQAQVRIWMAQARPDVVVLAAAKVGGIAANQNFPADFIYDNLMIAANVIHSAHETGVRKLLFLGSSCIYPKDAPQPMREDMLLSGALEPSNAPYALAKLAGIGLCQSYRRQHGQDFIAVMPCNLYGPGDQFDAAASHVISALMLKAHAAKMQKAKEWNVWGSGRALREFLYVDDLAEALVFVLKHYSSVEILNIGSGEEITIGALARQIAGVVGLEAEIVFDESAPEGVARKIMDSGRIFAQGWRPKVALSEGLVRTYEFFLRTNA